MASVKWKSAEVLKVYGTTIREGIYTGNKLDVASGKIVPDLPTEFTPDRIARIYDNIKTHVPIYLGHSASPDRKPIGYAFKFGVTETLDDIKYSGFIFDKDAINKIVVEGYNKVSPELNDDISELQALAFVQVPAIEGTEAEQMELKVFNAPAQIDNKGAQTMTENEGVQPTTNVQTMANVQPSSVVPSLTNVHTQPMTNVQPPVNTPAPERQSDIPVRVEELSKQVEEFRSKYEQANARIESLLTQQYDAVVAEMKGLGVSDPGSIVRGLPTEQKIAVLSKMKESIIMNKPIAGPTTSPAPADKSSVDNALDEVLAELGISKESYAKIAKRR